MLLFFKWSRRHRGGFSLVEMIVGSAIAIFAVLVVSYIMIDFRKTISGSEKIAMSSTDYVNNVFLHSLVLNASPAYHFENLAIPMQCDGAKTKPCLQVFDSYKQTFSPATNLPKNLNGDTTVQFFKDQTGSLALRLAANVPQNKTSSIFVKVAGHEDIDLSVLKKNMVDIPYATWPLMDDKSPPFAILSKRSNFKLLFTHLGIMGNSNASTPYSLFTAPSVKDSDLAEIKGSMVVVYNSSDPRQYYMGVISDAFSCASGDCKSIRNSVNTAIPDTALVGLVALNISPVLSSKDLATDLAAAGLGTISAGWPDLSSSALFPTSGTSMQMSGAGGGVAADLSNPVDIKKVQHFFTAINSSSSTLVVLPVQLVLFSLQKNSNGIVGSFDLTARIAGQTQVNTIITQAVDSSPGGTNKKIIYFARQLGSTVFNLFQE